MTIRRRQFLRLAAGVAALPVLPRFAGAQGYPSRPIRFVVGFPAGGTTDIAARIVGQWLSERLGQPVIVDNRPGAGTNIATEAVVRAPADGHTLLLVTTANVINATFYDKLSYNFIRDIAMVSGLVRTPLVLVAHPSLPATDVPALIADAKANPDAISVASFGTGTISHLTGQLFCATTGTRMVHVPYRGSAPMVTDLVAGQVKVAFDNLPASIEHIRAGTLRALAVTTATRSDTLPNVPVMNEFVPGFEASAWNGVGVPSATPAEIVERLSREIAAALADPKIKARFADLGATPMAGSPAELGRHVVAETDKWAKVVRQANIRAG